MALHTNYGGVLQAYALQTVLKRMGHEVVLIERVKPESDFSIRDIVYLLRSWKIRRFVRNKVCIKKVKQFSELAYLDAIVVGSDQIWRSKLFADFTDPFLGFSRNWRLKRIAYAASFGTDIWEYTPEQTKVCGELLNLFDAISVREESAQLFCNEYLGVKTQFVLDPTMLLDVTEYHNLIKRKPFQVQPPLISTYILDENADKATLVKLVQKSENMKRIVKLGRGSLKGRLSILQPFSSVEQWLCGFQNTHIIITDSFHACVFAILFHKPFIVYGNKVRGMARFYSLLKLFGLEDRLILSSHEFIDKKMKPINWAEVDSRLNTMRQFSYSFLHGVLTSDATV